MNDKDLQIKLNEMLAQAIKDIEALGYEHYPILPQVRITSNTVRLGSAQTVNGAALVIPRRGRKKGTPYWKNGIEPTFRISITRLECNNDDAIRNILLHEVIHTCEGCMNHGVKFKKIAAEANAAYGTDITVSKKTAKTTAQNKANSKEIHKMLETHIGEKFKTKRKTFTFVGFNNKPKYCCDLVDERGITYTAPASSVAENLGII